MTARAHSRGHPIAYWDGRWRYADSGRPAFDGRLCARCGRRPVYLRVPVEDPLTGRIMLQRKPIDACIAERVQAMNAAGRPTKTACCGHGQTGGWISLATGETIHLRKQPMKEQAGAGAAIG